MRNAFIDELVAVAATDQRVFLVCGDLGYSVLERFSTRFPDRFLNAGVAEQNMTGVAAGLAHAGYQVFVYSIVNFPIMRCLEQVRNDVAYHNLNVKIVAVGGGLVYGGHGYTHHGAEDLAVMRSLPNMTVVAPGDPVETRLAVRAVAANAGPCYLRLGRGGEPAVHMTDPVFQLGHAIPLYSGHELTIATIGGTLGLAERAVSELSRSGASITLLSFPTLHPFDNESLLSSVRVTGRLLTIEEHGWGGLATAAAESLAFAGLSAQFTALRLRREPVDCAGTHDYLRAQHGISQQNIQNAVRQLLSSQ